MRGGYCNIIVSLFSTVYDLTRHELFFMKGLRRFWLANEFSLKKKSLISDTYFVELLGDLVVALQDMKLELYLSHTLSGAAGC